MKSFYLFPLFLLFFSSCGPDNSTPENGKPKPAAKPHQNLTFEQRAQKEARISLKMSPKEKFKMAIYTDYINADTILDAVVTINREDFMIDRYTREGRIAKMAEIGFIARYNYFMYYDGASGKFTLPIPIPSSCNVPLQVNFVKIVSPAKKDIVISYRAKDSGWKDYYTVIGETGLEKFFQWETYTRILKEDREVKMHYIDSSLGIFPRDIVIYKSELDHKPESEKEIYTFDNSTSRILGFERRFFYDPKIGKMRLSQATK